MKIPVGPTKILLVEDNPVDALYIRNILSNDEQFSARLECADSLASASDLLKDDYDLDLIILDLRLQDSHDLNTFRKIRLQAPDIPVIILTGIDDAQTAMQAVHEGAEDYLVKGDLSSALLVRSIRHAAERHRTKSAFWKSNESLRRANRALTVLSRCNGVLTRAKDESKLLGEACRILVEIGGYALAWVGFAESDDDKRIRVVAKWGHDEGRLDRTRISWADNEYGRSPAGTAIRTKLPHISRFIATDPGFEPWRAAAIQLGYRSAAAFPLIADDSCFGALSIVSEQPDAFDGDEAKLLTELADDLSYGIMNVRRMAERRKIEEDLRQSERFLTNVLASIQDGISILDTDFNIVRVNPKLESIMAHAMPVIGKKCFEAYRGRANPCEICPAQETLKTGQPTSTVIPVSGPNGQETWVEINTFPLVDAETGKIEGVVEHGRDVTQRRQVEEALRESEERYRTLFDQSKDGVYITTREGRLVEANQAYLDLFGFTKEEAQNLDILQIYPEPVMENRQRFREAIEKTGSVKDFELKLKTKDGRLIDCLSTSTVKKAADGTTTGYQGIVRDITEYKQLQNELVQAQKMEAIGTLAGGLSHDFNNILTVIHGYAELLIMDHDDRDPRLNDLHKIVEAAKTGSELVRSLLAFSRRSEIQSQPMNLNKQVEQVRQLLCRTIPKMIRIETVLSAEPATINADPGQVGQVLMNLAINAKDAMPDGGALTIETRNITADDEYCRTHLGLKPGAYVLLTVSDTGCGIGKETLEHIFEPFFTTKEVGIGTGLGLAMVYGIVKQHGGEIICSSKPDSGTTFSIYLPALLQDEQGLEPAPVKEPPTGGKETILLVDDEASIRTLGIKMLSRAGYTVLTAPDGQAALKTYQEQGAEISLVILDLMMPEMGGKRCLEKLLEIDPKAKVIISTGYSMDQRTKEIAESGARGFVLKPFQLTYMLNTVREVLDEN